MISAQKNFTFVFFACDRDNLSDIITYHLFHICGNTYNGRFLAKLYLYVWVGARSPCVFCVESSVT